MMEYMMEFFDEYVEYDDVVHITFEEGVKRYVMDGGWLISNIYSVINPNYEHMFRRYKKDMYVFGNNGEYIELHYEREEEDE